MPGASSISSQSDCCSPSASVANSCDSSKRVVANTTVSEADAVGVEARLACRTTRTAKAPSASPVTSSIRTPHGAVVLLSRSTPRAARSSVVASVRSWPADRISVGDGIERVVIGRLEADERRVVGGAGFDEHAVHLVVVAPGAGRPDGSARHRAR